LVAILMPALSRAGSAADAAVCKNNLRQVSIGLQLYRNEFGAYVPSDELVNTNNTRNYANLEMWYQKLKPYVGAGWPESNQLPTGRPVPRSGVFACPGYNRIPGAYVGGPGTPNSYYPATYGAYGYNYGGDARIFDERQGPEPSVLGLGGISLQFHGTGMRATREMEVVTPSDMIAIGDAPIIAAVDSSGSWITPSELFGINPAQSGLGYVNLCFGLSSRMFRLPRDSDSAELKNRRALNQRRHSGRFNILFCDGHLEYDRGQKFFDAVGKPGIARRWNTDNQPHLNLLTTAGGL